MQSRRYTEEDLVVLLNGVGNQIPLSDLERELGRTYFAIGQKLGRLSARHPETWPPDMTTPYIKEAYRRHQAAYPYNWKPERIARAKVELKDFLAQNPHARIRDLKGPKLTALMEEKNLN